MKQKQASGGEPVGSTLVEISSSRPPIVAVLGHIDHGKTSLLDKIRRTKLAEIETAGITQHVGAYQITVKGAKKITFIDTPGHAAFSQMRSRGSKVADLAVLVVAADEGFKPQTDESLKHIQAAQIPFLVAINKIDLPNVEIEKVKKDLAKNGIKLEGEGGDVVALPVSAKTGEGIEDLLEMILLLAEMKGVRCDPRGNLEAVVIESKLDRAQGPLATLVVRNGSLKIGDQIRVEQAEARVKAMLDENKKEIKVARPGKPVEVLGFKQVPPVGGKVEKKQTDGWGEIKGEVQRTAKTKPEIEKEAKSKKLKLILKTDVLGTLEAIRSSLPENTELIEAKVGDVNDSDVLLAQTTGAQIIGFRIKAPGSVKKLIDFEKVKFESYQTIYDLLEAVETAALKVMEPTIDEEVLGQAEIIAEFEADKQRVAGCRVFEGRITKKDKLHLRRATKLIGNCRIKSMKREKDEVGVVEKGTEFGVILSPSLDFEIGDVLVSYRPEKSIKW